jgi:hypothetical protein
MIYRCQLPTTADIAKACNVSRQAAHAMLASLALTEPIYQERGRWLWNGDERAWAVADLVERFGAHHTALDVLVEELRGM